MYGQMTAGSWIYIGTQGIVQGTYETFAACARAHFGGALAGRLVVSAGCGGMGGAQPLAVTMNGGVCLIADVDRGKLQRRLETRYLDEIAGGVGEIPAQAIDQAIDRARATPPPAARSRSASRPTPSRCWNGCSRATSRRTRSPTRRRRTT